MTEAASGKTLEDWSSRIFQTISEEQAVAHKVIHVGLSYKSSNQT